MSDNIRLNAGVELDRKAKEYKQANGGDYRHALEAVLRKDTTLARQYSWGADAAETKKYDDTVGHDTTPAQRAMSAMYNETPEKIMTLAGWALDHLARRQLQGVGGIPDPISAYRQAVVDIRRSYPSLAAASDSGYFSGKDWELLDLLVPSVQGEIQKGNYSRKDSNRCRCGRNINLCRGEKMAARRGVHEDNVKAFAECILQAREHGNELDKIRCYY